MNTPSDGTVVYSAVLRPHHSIDESTTLAVAVAVATVMFVVGIAFIVAGAWPVTPFLGLESLLLLGAFHLNRRAGFAYEAINLTARALTVRRVDFWGNESDFSFPPYWLQVNIDEPPNRKSPLELRSHGTSLIIGSFLLPEERLQLAYALRRELHRLNQSGR
ncbi:MAG: DUF2244 domain-containing protein [Rhodospirillales bacterium]|nr:DUF2244 domain-containing protein [Rhodospirillales bacterium]